ncbi:MAG: methyl-accepting chemotaxis protein [Pseudomonadota bacterium]
MIEHAEKLTQTSATPPTLTTLSGDVIGALINLSGRRRFTSQRVVLYAVLASMGHDGAIATARETLGMLRDAHVTLVEGKGVFPGVFCEQLREAYFGTLQGDKAIRIFIRHAESTLDAISDNTHGAPGLLEELLRISTPLLSILNGLTLMYEEQSKRHAQAQRKELQTMMAEIKVVSKQARVAALSAQIVAARAGLEGKQFAAEASNMTSITGQMDELVHKALHGALAH